MIPRWVTIGFIAAGLVNILGILIFSRGFTNDTLSAVYPEVASKFGLVCIMLWGLAYLSVARHPERVPLLCLVFALEKTVYVVSWVMWWADHGSTWNILWQQDRPTALFYAIYGPNDFLFGVFFAWCFWKYRRG